MKEDYILSDTPPEDCKNWGLDEKALLSAFEIHGLFSQDSSLSETLLEAYQALLTDQPDFNKFHLRLDEASKKNLDFVLNDIRSILRDEHPRFNKDKEFITNLMIYLLNSSISSHVNLQKLGECVAFELHYLYRELNGKDEVAIVYLNSSILLLRESKVSTINKIYQYNLLARLQLEISHELVTMDLDELSKKYPEAVRAISADLKDFHSLFTQCDNDVVSAGCIA